jgi:hypothetical protein
LQVSCQERGAAVLVGHHFNRREGASREERVSGAGIHEWGRFLITVEKKKGNRATDEGVEVVRFEITGNSINPVAFTVRRHVVVLDDSPNPELSYYVQITDEGPEPPGDRRFTAGERIREAMGADRLSVAEIQDRTAHDLAVTEHGMKPLQTETVGRELRRLRESGEVDTDGASGVPGRWWRV